MIRNGRTDFGLATRLLHWVIALLILGLVALGFVMVRVAIDPALQFSLYQWHKSFGLTALGLALLRLLWRLADRMPEPIADLSAGEQRSAALMHLVLLALTLAVPLAGWALASTSTLGIPTLLFDRILVPHLPLAASASAEAFWTTAHSVLAYGLLALVGLHAAAALYHHFIRKDRVLVRMLPGTGRPRQRG